MKCVRFTVPFKPVGVNSGFTGGKRPFVKTDEAREFSRCVAWHGCNARLEAGYGTFPGPCSVRLCFYFANERPDIDGPIKLVLRCDAGIADE